MQLQIILLLVQTISLNNVNNGVFIGVADKDNTTSNVTNTVSIGTKNVVSGDQTIAMGTEAKATANGAMAIGYKVQATGRGAIAIGGNQKEPGDYVDVPTTIASGRQSIAMGYRAISEGNLSTAIGYGAHTEGATSVAIGTGSATTADDGTAVGNGAMARSARASAYGTSSRADGENSVAIGYYSDAIAANSVAIGSYTAIDESAENTVVIGGNSRDFFTAKNATAVGANTYVYENGGVALGANSRAGEAVSTSSAVINGHVYNFAGGHASSTVSVGVANGMVDGDGNPVEETYRTVTNVAAGRINAESTDAINGSQLHSVIQEMSSVASDTLTKANNYTDNQVNKVGAASAALAALHPLDFDPDHKLDVMAGYGHFHGSNSVALGAAYRPNEDLMFTVGSTVGNGDTVVNAGISYKVGAKSGVSRSKVSVAKDVADMKREMEAMKAQNAKITAILNAVLGADLPEDQTSMFPDVPANHWAYEAVNDMAKRGLVIGYEDGQFKGDRTMTRYEFAMIVERAIQKAKELNTSIDGRLVDEFKPELLRFEIEKNGSLERVHTLKSNKEIQRDSYGTIITK